MDIGTPERYLQASWDILTGAVRTEVAARVDDAGFAVDEHADVDALLVAGRLPEAAERIRKTR